MIGKSFVFSFFMLIDNLVDLLLDTLSENLLDDLGIGALRDVLRQPSLPLGSLSHD